MPTWVEASRTSRQWHLLGDREAVEPREERRVRVAEGVRRLGGLLVPHIADPLARTAGAGCTPSSRCGRLQTRVAVPGFPECRFQLLGSKADI